jgi:two-component system OmpR family response regulator
MQGKIPPDHSLLRHILHVEDEADIRMLTRIALEDIGNLQVTSASGPAEAEALLAGALMENPPDLILMDVMMPDKTGPELLASLRRTCGSSLPPVIFMTAKILPVDRQTYRLDGCIGFISKPFDPLTLASELVSIWKEHHG